jgi:hypothetical protein
MLRITRTDALLGIRSTPAKMQISQPKPDFELRHKDAKVLLHTEPVQIRIDQSQCRNEIGYKDNEAFGADAAARGQQAVLEGIARRVGEGNQLAQVPVNGNAIAQIAAQNSLQVDDYNIDFLPKSKPEIDFVGGRVDISVDEGYVELQSKPNKPIIDVEIGTVEIYLRQRPELEIQYIGSQIDESR